MSGTPYFDGDKFDEMLDVVLIGAMSVGEIADVHRVDPEYLGRLLQLPTSQQQQPMQASEDVDLWAMDRLHAVL